MNKITLILFFIFYLNISSSQSDACNDLGVWMWHFEITEFENHEMMADSLSGIGIKRLYAKVADGSLNAESWPEIIDESMVNNYHDQGMEVWAWSYNYPGNVEAQAQALYVAAETGFDGYVIDVEMQFDGEPQAADALFEAFYNARQVAIDEGIIDDDFKIYCTTWGNPQDHNFPISSIDPYVDAFMPQTYVEIWGQSYIDDITYWIEEGDREYEELGSTKPNHHIVAMEKDILVAEEVNEFIKASGGETSIWRIPGGGTPLSIWEQWREIDWSIDLCEHTSIKYVEERIVSVNPNPSGDFIKIDGVDFEYYVISNSLATIIINTKSNSNTINVSELIGGYYYITLVDGDKVYSSSFVKI